MPETFRSIAPTDAEEQNTIRSPLLPIASWELHDSHFAFDSSILLPSMSGELLELIELVRANPGAPLTVYGHADPTGEEGYNKILSGRRAMALFALLTRRVDLWEQLFNNPAGNDDWKKDGQAVRIMTEVVGGTTPLPRPDLFKKFMDILSVDADGKSFGLPARAFLGKGADPKGKMDFQGCGEFNPVLVFSEQERREFLEPGRKTARDEANAPNRRVTVFLFPQDTEVALEAWPCPRAGEGIGKCQKRLWSDFKARKANTEQRRVHPAQRDTFQCRFYDRFIEGVPTFVSPTFFTIEQPGATNSVRMHSLRAYLVLFRRGSTQFERVKQCFFREGKLIDPRTNRELPLETERDLFFYFSHRDDLDQTDQSTRFAKDRSGLPLLGPFRIPRGQSDPQIELDIWRQLDWAIVRGPRVDGVRPSPPQMAEWREDYTTGRLQPLKKGGMGFFPHGNQVEKMRQERWRGQQPIELIQLGNPGGNPMWVGTLSLPPADRLKILLNHRRNSPTGPIQLNVTSYNEIKPTGANQDFPGHHRFNNALVQQLLAIPATDQPNAAVDALPAPPRRVLLPGDACWQDQGETNNCGAFSFSTAMNYWMPYTNNPIEKDGNLYSKPGNVDDTINGARTPQDIVNAAGKFRMNGRDNDAEDLDRSRGLKLLRLWLVAGVPVVFLVAEEYNVWSLHWKTVVGYDGDRFFMNNSGADNEVIRAERDPGVEYEKAPVGNDVDSEAAFFRKWREAGGNVVDLITSVDRCTFIPLFPKDPVFAGPAVI